MIAVLSCWLYFEPVSGMWLEIIKACTCLGLTFLIPDVVSFICFVFFLPEFGQEWKRKIRSRHGTNSEPDWPFTMGLQNIWRTRFQEGHNCIKGIRWQQSWRWTLSHLIIPYPFFFLQNTDWNAMSCSQLPTCYASFLVFVYVRCNSIPISLTTEPIRIEWK